MSKIAYEITNTTTPTSVTITAASHHHFKTTNETVREENNPHLELFRQYRRIALGMATNFFQPRHSTICTVVHDLHHRIQKNKIVPLPRYTKKKVSVGYVADLAIDNHLRENSPYINEARKSEIRTLSAYQRES
jgi:hypothetical protein